MIDKKKKAYIAVVLVFALGSLTLRPGLWLVDKPASTQNTFYVKGWEEGCISGANSYSLLFAPMLEKPFIKELDTTSEEAVQAEGNDYYKTGWNEGFTMCRYYQSSVYELMQFAMVIATLLFIGYLIARRRP